MDAERGAEGGPLSAISYEECIAKTSGDRPGMKVAQHCRIVGSVARALMSRLPGNVVSVLPGCSATIAALHDVGKVSPGFQKRISPEHVRRLCSGLASQSAAGLETDHSAISGAAVRRFLGVRFGPCAAAEIVAAHHGRAAGRLARSDTASRFGGPKWAEERHRLLDALTSEFGAVDDIPLETPSLAALAGLVTVADWIGSDEEFFSPAGLPAHADLEDLAANALDECGWQIPEIVPGLPFDEIFGFSPHPLQQSFAEVVTGPGLYILEAPMGSGKTEAALFAAYRLMSSGASRGLYFGLPTRLTSDKIHERVTPFLKRICSAEVAPKLAHGTAWLKAFEHGGEGLAPGYSWFNPRKRTVLHPFGVGTIDQALLAVLRVKHYFVRSFGLAGKVVILDEVHSYDVYTGTLLEKLVRHLLSLRCTVMILSATLTGERRARLLSGGDLPAGGDAYPVITAERNGHASFASAPAPAARDYVVRTLGWPDASVAEHAVAKAADGNCVLCIANTVAKAQQWYDAVSANMAQGQFALGLLHSRFPAFRREQLEGDWMERLGKGSDRRPEGCVLVATQVVEQSVDIDADLLITELAPTDMLLQRMGRVWRHEREGRPGAEPEVTIISGDPETAQTRDEIVEALGPKNCLVYQPYILWRSWLVWAKLGRVCLPDEIRALIERTYAAPDEDERAAVRELRQFLDDWRDRLEKLAHSAEASVKGLGVMEDDERAATRYSDLPMVDVLLVRAVETDGREAQLSLLDGGRSVRVHADRKDFPVTALLHKQLVAVPRYLVARLGRLETPFWLRKHFYDPTPVWAWDPVSGALDWDGTATGFAYDDTRGLQRLGRIATPASRTYTEDYDEVDVFDKTRFDW